MSTNRIRVSQCECAYGPHWGVWDGKRPEGAYPSFEGAWEHVDLLIEARNDAAYYSEFEEE